MDGIKRCSGIPLFGITIIIPSENLNARLHYGPVQRAQLIGLYCVQGYCTAVEQLLPVSGVVKALHRHTSTRSLVDLKAKMAEKRLAKVGLFEDIEQTAYRQ